MGCGEGRKGRGVAVAVGLVAGFVFFAFFPGLPQVVDRGAVLVSLGVGALARWGWRGWVRRTRGEGVGTERG
ncbi:hypothetical protein D0C37_12715 [Streptomyces koyangensis]|uniref:Uncharacterized protein n=1 Tax=Streptomyces koyangensis TaxID=188770 RepID=A0A385DKG8_9ACTN|nr:hypothetical protein D0C37_12715 [Streptomyces koyangensis]